MDFHGICGLGFFLTLTCGEHLVGDPAFGLLRIGRGGGDVFGNGRCRWRGLERDQLDVRDDQSAGSLRLRQPALALLARLHPADDLGEFRWHFVKRHAGRRGLCAAVLHHLAVRGFGSEMEGDNLIRSRHLARAFLGDLVGDPTLRFLGIGRSLGCFLDGDQFHIKDQHATGAAAARNGRAVGEFFRNPETALLTGHHQLETFGPALDHATEGETRGLTAAHRAIKHFPVRRPAGVMNGHRIGGGGFFIAGSGIEDFRGQTALGLYGIGGGGGYIGGCFGHDLFWLGRRRFVGCGRFRGRSLFRMHKGGHRHQCGGNHQGSRKGPDLHGGGIFHAYRQLSTVL